MSGQLLTKFQVPIGVSYVIEGEPTLGAALTYVADNSCAAM